MLDSREQSGSDWTFSSRAPEKTVLHLTGFDRILPSYRRAGAPCPHCGNVGTGQSTKTPETQGFLRLSVSLSRKTAESKTRSPWSKIER